VFWLPLAAQGGRIGYCGEGLGLGLGVLVGGPEDGPPKGEEPTGEDVLLAGWPTPPALPPLMVCMSEIGSYVNSHSL
jgi:hypothetical protein